MINLRQSSRNLSVESFESENSGDGQRILLSRRQLRDSNLIFISRSNLSIAQNFIQKNNIEDEDEMITSTNNQFAETSKIKFLNDSED
jgi:hypothetical protein